jgi:tRNA pseudouridine38-40 synthase
VQEAVERAIRAIVQEPVTVTGAGRTDAGVHALGQVVHFRCATALPARKLRLAFNAKLPVDVSFVDVEDAPEGFHARFHARSKLYRYTMLPRRARPAVGRAYVHWVRAVVDEERMREGAALFVGTHDFTAFCAAAARGRRVRRITRSELTREGPLLHYWVEGDGFLYNMVRGLVGTLLEVGRGALEPSDVRRLLERPRRREAGPTAPPEGLCLIAVRYGDSALHARLDDGEARSLYSPASSS